MNDDPNNIEREIAKMKARADEAEKRGQAERRDDKTAKGKGGSPPDLRSAAKDWRAQRGNANPPRPNGGEGDDAPTVAVLLVVSAASFAGKPVPARRWIVPDMIPDRTVTSLGGDGGVGKSIVALQLAVAAAAGCEWIGTLPEQGSVVFVSAEDDIDELHRRLDGIAAKLGVALTNLADLHIIPLAGRDAIMGATEGKTGIVKATAVWRGLVEIVERIRPRLVILDVLADVFAGNENARPEARQFIGLLRGLAIDHALAVVLLAHPSLTGMNTGSGTSGSTAWSNSVRSRLYLETIKGDDGKEIDANLRILRVKKANYGRVGLELRLRWENPLLQSRHADRRVQQARHRGQGRARLSRPARHLRRPGPRCVRQPWSQLRSVRVRAPGRRPSDEGRTQGRNEAAPSHRANPRRDVRAAIEDT